MNKSLTKTLLARQGIYNKNGSVHAYEILYRNGDDDIANIDNFNLQEGDAATSSVITQLFTNLDMDTIIGKKRAFINFTYNHLIQHIPELLPKDRIVIEVLETVSIDEPLLNSLIDMHQKGYQIALDDFIYKKEFAPLIEIADVIKIDVINLDKDQIITQLERFKGYKGKLLAEKIEDKEQFSNCIELGFDYFQGFFLNKPAPLKGQVITENKANLLRLLAELNNDDVPLERVEEIILQIPKLSYRILRLANSASLYFGHKIDSVLDAVLRLGLLQIRNWLNLLLLASLDDVQPDLLERTLIRAKMCEHLAKASHFANPHQAYTVGILSTLDGILNEPMSSLLAKIQLNEAINEALLENKGELGTILKFTKDYEEANFNLLENASIKFEDFTHSYLKGIEYAQSVLNIINQ